MPTQRSPAALSWSGPSTVDGSFGPARDRPAVAGLVAVAECSSEDAEDVVLFVLREAAKLLKLDNVPVVLDVDGESRNSTQKQVILGGDLRAGGEDLGGVWLPNGFVDVNRSNGGAVTLLVRLDSTGTGLPPGETAFEFDELVRDIGASCELSSAGVDVAESFDIAHEVLGPRPRAQGGWANYPRDGCATGYYWRTYVGRNLRDLLEAPPKDLQTFEVPGGALGVACAKNSEDDEGIRRSIPHLRSWLRPALPNWVVSGLVKRRTRLLEGPCVTPLTSSVLGQAVIDKMNLDSILAYQGGAIAICPSFDLDVVASGDTVVWTISAKDGDAAAPMYSEPFSTALEAVNWTVVDRRLDSTAVVNWQISFDKQNLIIETQLTEPDMHLATLVSGVLLANAEGLTLPRVGPPERLFEQVVATAP